MNDANDPVIWLFRRPALLDFSGLDDFVEVRVSTQTFGSETDKVRCGIGGNTKIRQQPLQWIALY